MNPSEELKNPFIIRVKENPYLIAPEVEKIAKPLLNTLTKQANISYIFADKKTRYAGKIQKVSKEVKLITDLDYIMFINLDFWEEINNFKREALVFHELEHIEWKENIKDPNFGSWVLRRHDLEEFNSVVAKYGKWSPNIEVFYDSVNLKLKPTTIFEDEKQVVELRKVN